ncbi:MAG: AAA family ATPase [Verrucomicrobiota bacterium]
MKNQLITYLSAGYSGLAIITAEEVRAEAEIAAACDSLKHHLHAWSSSEGLANLAAKSIADCPDPLDALLLIERVFASQDQRQVVVMRDLQPHLDQTDPMLIRRLKDLLRMAKSGGHAIILLGCRLKLPAELEHEITQVDFSLPDGIQLGVVLDGILKSAKLKKPNEAVREAILQSALGLTTTEAENAFSLSLAETKRIDHRIISREKARTLKRNGLVEVIETTTTVNDIGGLDPLKEWLDLRRGAFSASARAYGLPAPKGLLIVGIPGTGKSLTAKATAAAFGLPLLRIDMGRVFGGIVGQSEANLRSVIQTAEAIAPCVLFIDEVEKGFSGSQSSGSTDGGTSARVFGSFLTWMQERTKSVFVVATANDVSQLPAPFLRKGRFDEMFFVDLPDAIERAAIWDIVIRRYRRRPELYDIADLARASDQFTGAEIEAVFVDAMYAAYAEGSEPAPKYIAEAIRNTVPIAKLMDSQIKALREWAKGRARHATNRPASPPQSGSGLSLAN